MSDIHFSHGLWFDDQGWLGCHPNFPYKIIHKPTKRLWKGMHDWIKSNYGNKFQGTITHYDALDSAARTAAGFTRDANGASTHFVIDRGGDIYQLASIQDRTWHAGQNANEWAETDGWFTMPNGEKTKSPNHWFLGIDLSNWGYLTYDKTVRQWKSHAGVVVPVDLVELDAKKRGWEIYQQAAIDTYGDLLAALVSELGIAREMNIGHSDSAPKNKVDPGPMLHLEELVMEVYEELELLSGPSFDNCREGDRESH